MLNGTEKFYTVEKVVSLYGKVFSFNQQIGSVESDFPQSYISDFWRASWPHAPLLSSPNK